MANYAELSEIADSFENLNVGESISVGHLSDSDIRDLRAMLISEHTYDSNNKNIIKRR